MVSQSQQFANELNGFLRQQGGGRQDSTTVKGKFYRAWMDAKAAITGADEKAILGSNIYGEEWAIKAYEDALSDNTLRGAVRQAVERQYQHSKQTYNRLKSMDGKQE
ncbi:PA2169 family four-helix-bundle protein [Hymenobacter cellulosilyticus]|uniref:PA2169 family four-helix-bundle protein n=1 Tax=Hymenobacter cellulosilyticus TaxID=2932248 RepID=UPI0021D41355|nr:PA2169 family four-helix-bundle protein [Hymenobacter cellulosilyticus]